MEVASSCEFRQTGGSLEFLGRQVLLSDAFGGSLGVGLPCLASQAQKEASVADFAPSCVVPCVSKASASRP